MMVIGVLAIGAVPAFAANQLLVTSAAALPGSVAQPGVNCSGDGQPGPCGLEVVIDDYDNVNDTYVVTSHPNAETTYNFSFYIDPNDIFLQSKKYIAIGNLRKTNLPNRNFFFVYLRKSGSGGHYWEIQTNARLDNGAFPAWHVPVKICGDATTTIPCDTVGPQEFRIEWAAATAPGANDGFLRVYKNGTVRTEWTGLDNDTLDIDEAWFGAIWMANNTQGVAANGSFYFDTFTSTR
jgi:hypothetical protein